MNVALAREIYGGQPWLLETNTFLSLKDKISTLDKVAGTERLNTVQILDAAMASGPGGGSSSSGQDKKISVTNINGVITKSGGASSSGMKELSAALFAADADPKISGHLFILDSPGGSAAGAFYMQETMNQLTKKKVGIVERSGMAASGGYAILSACDYIFAEDGNAEVGSIGVMYSFDGHPSGSTDANGAKHFTVYATKSTKKNEAVTKALNNDDISLVVEEADKINDFFHTATRGYRPNIKEEHLTGAMFPASEVIGTMVDAIGTKKDAVNKVLELSNLSNNFSTNYKKPNKLAMTAPEIKSQFPEAYEAIHGAGHSAGLAAGVQQEKDRVSLWQVYADIDPEAVNAGISSGKEMTRAEEAVLNRKAGSIDKLAALKKDSPSAVVTPEAQSAAAELSQDEKDWNAMYPGITFPSQAIKN